METMFQTIWGFHVTAYREKLWTTGGHEGRCVWQMRTARLQADTGGHGQACQETPGSAWARATQVLRVREKGRDR